MIVQFNFAKSLLLATILVTFCFCGNKTALYNKEGIDKFDLYDFNSIRALLNKDVQKIKIDPTLNVLSYDSTLDSNDGRVRRIILLVQESKKILSFEIENDSIQRITIFSDKIVSKSKPSVGQIFSNVSTLVLPYLPKTINGSVGLLDSDDDCIVYHFEFLEDPTLINENNLERILENSRIIKIVIQEPMFVYNETPFLFDQK